MASMTPSLKQLPGRPTAASAPTLRLMAQRGILPPYMGRHVPRLLHADLQHPYCTQFGTAGSTWHHSSRNASRHSSHCWSKLYGVELEGPDGNLPIGSGMHQLMRPQFTLSPPWGSSFPDVENVAWHPNPSVHAYAMMCGEESLFVVCTKTHTVRQSWSLSALSLKTEPRCCSHPVDLGARWISAAGCKHPNKRGHCIVL